MPAVAIAGALMFASDANADTFRLRIASGHASANTYVNLMQNYFVPEVTKRTSASCV
jgi:hypothetical protein